MQKTNTNSPFILIFTDLDGTLLDHNTYQWGKAEPALAKCKKADFPVIMVSSKTSVEMEVHRKEIGLTYPFISENGGGIFFPNQCSVAPPPEAIKEEHGWKLPLGPSYEDLVKNLDEIRKNQGVNIQGFSDMTIDDISRMTGLNIERSRLAATREYDEPFIINEKEPIDITILENAAQQKGLKISKGGRFFHLHGKNDKGYAIKKLILWYKKTFSDILTVALGDSPNDFSMFYQVDQAVLIRSKQSFDNIEKEFNNIIITQESGPEGWNVAINKILNTEGGLS